MTEETWTIEMGSTAYVVPRLPIKYSRIVYPICQRLTNGELPERILIPKEPLQLTDDEMDDLIKICFVACQAAEPNMTEEQFFDLAITPPQLYDAFFAIRKACGGWRAVEGQKMSGEDPPTSEPPT